LAVKAARISISDLPLSIFNVQKRLLAIR
jgi:hypothetical protein